MGQGLPRSEMQHSRLRTNRSAARTASSTSAENSDGARSPAMASATRRPSIASPASATTIESARTEVASHRKLLAVSLFEQLRDYGKRYGFARTASRLASESLKQTGLFRHSVFVLLRPGHVDRSAYDAALPYERRLVPAEDMGTLAAQRPADLPPHFLDDA